MIVNNDNIIIITCFITIIVDISLNATCTIEHTQPAFGMQTFALSTTHKVQHGR